MSLHHSPPLAHVRCSALISAFCGSGRRWQQLGSGTRIGRALHTKNPFLAKGSIPATPSNPHPQSAVTQRQPHLQNCNPSGGRQGASISATQQIISARRHNTREIGRRPGATLTCGTTLDGAHRHPLSLARLPCAGPALIHGARRRARALQTKRDVCGSSTAGVGRAASVASRSYG